MESKDECKKVCWYTRAGNCLDYILLLHPKDKIGE